MDDAVFVGDGQGGGAVGDDASGDEPVIGAFALDAARRALGVEQLHHHVAAAIVFAGVVDGDDVGVVESARDLGFAHEALDDLGLVHQLIGQKLDGDLAPERCVFAFIDRTHAAATEQPDDLVFSKGFADARVDRVAIGRRRGWGLRRRAWLCHDRTSSAMADFWSISRLFPSHSPARFAKPHQGRSPHPSERCKRSGASPRTFSNCSNDAGEAPRTLSNFSKASVVALPTFPPIRKPL